MRAHLASLLVLCLAWPAGAATVLFDFETDAEVAVWRIRSAGQDRLERSDRFAASGQCSGLFRSPKWEQGMPEWPALEATPPVTDWSAYDRLCLVLANPTDDVEVLKLYVKDAKHPLQQGGAAQFTVPARSYRREMVPLAGFPEHMDLTDIEAVHFYTTRPPSDFAMHIDGVCLLDEGEEPPAWPAGLAQQLVALMLPEAVLEDAQKRVDACAERIRRALSGRPVLQDWAAGEIDALRQVVTQARTKLSAPDLSPERVPELGAVLARVSMRADRLESLAALRARPEVEAYAVGFASSMEKVLPRDAPVSLALGDTASLGLARNETEAIQVAVVPFERGLEKVRVEVGTLEAANGERLPADCVDVRVVGYVETSEPPYAVPYVGWWPDPLLDFLPAVDVAAGDVQAFWVRVRAPKGQRADAYRGPIRVTAANAPATSLTLEIEVYDFVLPDRSPLPTAISVYDSFVKKLVADWDRGKLVWADFLADYYIDFDSLYRQGPPDFEILERLDGQGRLVAFNLGYFGVNEFEAAMTDEAYAAAFDKLVARLKPAYDHAEAAGIADRAYIYGFDECNQDFFPILERISQDLKRLFPTVPLLTTTRDHSFGLESGVTAMDGWTPLTPHYDPAKAAAARDRGKAVWWYICCGPAHPWANWFIEYPAIDTRLLMGAMTAKYRPDGFLYYAITRWPNNDAPIKDGPFTSWDPASYRDFNGDGSLLCPGPGGRPLATIRLENFRDGLEDYAYARILEATLAAKRAAGGPSADDAAWIERAEAALRVPEDVVEDLTRFTRDPDVIYAWRRRLAKAIATAGVPAADPWAD